MIDSFIQYINEYPPMVAATVFGLVSVFFSVYIFAALYINSLISKKEREREQDSQEQSKSN